MELTIDRTPNARNTQSRSKTGSAAQNQPTQIVTETLVAAGDRGK
jgi:hypothetical protein